MAKYWADRYMLTDAIRLFALQQISELEMIKKTGKEAVDEFFDGKINAYKEVIKRIDGLKKRWGKRKEDGEDVMAADAPFGIALRTANEIVNQCVYRAEELEYIKNPSPYILGNIESFRDIDAYANITNKKYDRAFEVYEEVSREKVYNRVKKVTAGPQPRRKE